MHDRLRRTSVSPRVAAAWVAEYGAREVKCDSLLVRASSTQTATVSARLGIRPRSVGCLWLSAALWLACRRHEVPPDPVSEQTRAPGASADAGTPDEHRLGPRIDDPFVHDDAAVEPTIHVGNMNVEGGLDATHVRQVLNQNAALFARCGAPRADGSAIAHWMVGLHFEIGADGRVRSATRGASRPPEAEFTDCLTLVCRGLDFPRPDGGAGVQVDVTLGSVARP